MAPITTIADVRFAAVTAAQEVTITDIHTHLFPPSHGDMLLWGVDELLTYHYLISELFTLAPADLTYEKFWKLPKSRQADIVWEQVFVRQSPISEASRGVLTCLNALGLDVAGRDLKSIRSWFAGRKIEDYLPQVLDLAGLDYAVMTNNPFVPQEVDCWDRKLPIPQRLKTALRIDTMLTNWPAAAGAMRAAGYDVSQAPDAQSFTAARKFLADWSRRIGPLYMAASLGADFAYPSADVSTKVIDDVVAPVARELGLPVALMIGVRRGVNPDLHEGGDGVGVADVAAVLNLCQKHTCVKFLVTMLSRVNQHELCVTARKFGRNLHLFGCWWFCNNPSIIKELTQMRLELLGTAVTLQHSDARVLDQLIYKWKHTRGIVGDVLAQKYADLFVAGWRPTTEEIRRDARMLLGGRFEEFCKR